MFDKYKNSYSIMVSKNSLKLYFRLILRTSNNQLKISLWSSNQCDHNVSDKI